MDSTTVAQKRNDRIVAIVVIVLLFGGLGWGAKQIIDGPYNDLLAQQAAIQSGESNTCFANGDKSRQLFVEHIDSFRGLKPFKLDVSYGQKTDVTLQKLAGLDSIESLNLAKTDVSDAGLKSVATLPNLKHLALYKVHFSDAGLDYLTACPKLESLEALPREPNLVSLAKLVTLPRLKHLSLGDSAGTWIKPNYEQLKSGTNLETLRIDRELPDEILAELRQALPNTKIQSGHYPK